MLKNETYSSGEWLKADGTKLSLPGSPEVATLIIEAMDTHAFDADEKGIIKKQRVLKFRGVDVRLGLNVTNWDSIAALSGREDDDHWIGLAVTVYSTKVRFGAKMVDSVRIRAVSDPAMPAAAPLPPAVPPPLVAAVKESFSAAEAEEIVAAEVAGQAAANNVPF